MCHHGLKVYMLARYAGSLQIQNFYSYQREWIRIYFQDICREDCDIKLNRENDLNTNSDNINLNGQINYV